MNYFGLEGEHKIKHQNIMVKAFTTLACILQGRAFSDVLLLREELTYVLNYV